MEKELALKRLQDIQFELDRLGCEAAQLMRANFPTQYSRGDAYAAFTFGSSWNRFDITLQTLIDEAEEELEEDDDLVTDN